MAAPDKPDNPASQVRPEWARARRIVVKIGSSLLVDRASGELKSAWLESLADDIAALVKAGKQAIVVSSGAIALGRHVLGFAKGPLELERSQAAAAVGQISLAGAYQSVFKARGLAAAQILLTLGDTEERRRYLNARQTIDTLLAEGAVPVVNENDTVATAEIRYGDNDRLSARVASMMSADCLVLLSDVDGLYTAPPGSAAARALIAEVRQITPDIEAMAGGAGTELSRGGMVTKIEAGKIALASGTNMVIASGKVAPSPARACRRRALHVVAGPVRSRDRAQALDRRPARAQGRRGDRRRRREGAALRQEPAAGRRQAGGGRLRARRRGRHPRRRRARARPRPRRLRARRRGAHHRQENRARSRPSWALPAAPPWCTATTWS